LEETPREKWTTYLGLFASVIPGMIVTGFMPGWNVLPLIGWLAIATLGGGIAGALSTPLRFRGLISGAISYAGVFAGMLLYVTVRASLLSDHPIWRVELVVGALLGWSPGMILYGILVRRKEREISAYQSLREYRFQNSASNEEEYSDEVDPLR
jgi:hypothetical protein